MELQLHVAHLEHGLRGEESEADAEFVAETAAAWGLPCTVAHADVRGMAKQRGLSVEEAARQARYAFLGRLAEELGAHVVAVGHNADDQAETVLMHLLRGSGLAGLRGMRPSTRLEGLRLEMAGPAAAGEGQESGRSPLTTEVRLIRPLLFLPRADVLAYAKAHGLQPRFDRSNEDTTLFRNRLRHELLPLLETYNPQIREVLQRTAAVLGDDYEVLREQLGVTWPEVARQEAEERLVFDLQRWQALPPGLQRSILREGISRLRRSLRNINYGHVESAREALGQGTAGHRVTLPAGLELVIGYRRFALGGEGVQLPAGDVPQLDQARVALAVPGTTALDAGGEWRVATARMAVAKLPGGWRDNPDPWQAFLDATVVGTAPALRRRQEGDRFQPLGMGGRSKLLAEVFTNAKVPAAARDRWPLLVTTGGDIAWVCGLHVDERAKVTNRTSQVLHLRLAGRYTAQGEQP